MAIKKKNWIQNAIGTPGALHRALGVPLGTKLPMDKLIKAANGTNKKIAKEASLAITLRGFKHKKKQNG